MIINIFFIVVFYYVLIGMRHSLQVGFSFGITSGIITTLGLMVGLSSGTHNKLAVVGGILTIAIADSLSDQAKKYVAAHEALHIIGYHNETEVNYMAGRREPLGLLMTIFHSVGVNFKDRKITEYPCVFARMWRIFKFYFLDIG